MNVNRYPDWLIDRVDSHETEDNINEDSEGQNSESGDQSREVEAVRGVPEVKKKYPVVIPYIKGVSEQLRRVYKQYNVPAFFKPSNTLRQLLVRPKDKLGKEKVVGPVYEISCENCEAKYIGETERSLKARFQEHRRPSTTTSEVSRHIHVDQPSHGVDMKCAKILDVEPRWFEPSTSGSTYHP